MSGDPYIKENDELRNSLGEALVRENNLIAENAKLKEGVKQAEIVCDSYATENQQFSDTIDKLRAALEAIAKDCCFEECDRWKIREKALAAFANEQETK